MAATQTKPNVTIPGMSKGLGIRVGPARVALASFPSTGQNRVRVARAAKALGLRRRRAVSPQSPPSPNQESAMNIRTGKVAFGPWLAPLDGSPPSAGDPLFADRNGNTYASLAAAGQALRGVPTSAGPQPVGFSTGKAPAGAAAATQQLYDMMTKMVQRQAASAAAAGASRQPAQWLRGRSGKGSSSSKHGGGRCGTTMGRSINQPRRS